jgi:carboxyl-terminal processing protease
MKTMKKMNINSGLEGLRKKGLWAAMIVLVLLVASCKKDPEPVPEDETKLPEETLILDKWIWDGMNEVYLWAKYIPDLDYKKEADPEAFFYKLLYKDDRDSWIVDDYDALINMFQGVELATGMTVQPGLINDNDVISIVLYVTPDSPAADSGIQRGDVIISIDHELLTKDNYFDLYYQDNALFEFGGFDGVGVVHNGRFVELDAVELNQNPVVYSEVIDYEGAKIGYVVYTQFTSGQNDEWLDELNAVLDEFKAQNVTEVVVDLRYNGGGSLDLSAYFASSLGSASAMENNDIFVKLVWNDLYNQFWKEYDLDDDGNPDGEDSQQLVIKLPHSDRNLNLPRVYFLTTDGTASASESLMVGLYPYAEVVQIGTTTYGKCYGSITIDDTENPKRHNWAMQPIVIKYSNAEGFTDFVDGITPDYYVEEYLLELVPFGSLEDPMLAKALEDITGVAPAAKKSAERIREPDLLPVPRKRIPERVIEWPEKPGKRTLF